MTNAQLKELASSWLKTKRIYDEANKENKRLKELVKEEMLSVGKKSLATPEGTVVLTPRSTVSFKEKELLEYLDNEGMSRYIKKVVTYEVDYALLESDTYNGEIDPQMLDQFREVKVNYAISGVTNE